MKVFVEDKGANLSGQFLDTLADTIGRLGHLIIRGETADKEHPPDLAVVWNGKNHLVTGPVLFCELGWLPRWHFQISFRGINADSHLSPFEWDGRMPSDREAEDVASYMANLRVNAPPSFSHKKVPPVHMGFLPKEFLLVPMQMEWDPNVFRHTPNHLRRMQGLMDYISRIDPNLPVIYKQHPADVRRGNQQLRLDTHRPQDVILPHHRANIHQFLKSGQCKGIIALTSDVVHDGLWWDVPSVTLGRNIWPEKGGSPFLPVLPKDWHALPEYYRITRPCRIAYISFLKKNQWDPHTAADGGRVGQLIDEALQRYHPPKPVEARPKLKKPRKRKTLRKREEIPVTTGEGLVSKERSDKSP